MKQHMVPWVSLFLSILINTWTIVFHPLFRNRPFLTSRTDNLQWVGCAQILFAGGFGPIGYAGKPMPQVTTSLGLLRTCCVLSWFP